MPNHISNRLTLKADKVLVEKVFAEIKGDQECIDFNRIIPMPEILVNTCSGYKEIDGQRVNVWWGDNKYNKLPDRLLTTEELREIRQTGAENWHDWSVENWGTKWNAYDQSQADDSTLYFDTAWSAPIPILQSLSEKYPNVEFQLDYADEDKGSNSGHITAKNGILDHTAIFDEEAVKLWFQLNDVEDPSEYGYDPETFQYIEED